VKQQQKKHKQTMAVTTEFESNWLEMQEKYGAGIDSGDVEVIEDGEVDKTISLPAVKFQEKYVKDGTNVFVGFRHVPMDTFMAPIEEAVSDAEQATSSANEAAQTATEAAGSVQTAIDGANEAAQEARTAAGNVQTAIDGANAAKDNANNAATLADQKATLADQKATLANTAASNANEKATLADQKATLADQKATLAQQKADLANTAATNANAAAGRVDDAITAAEAATDGAENVDIEIDGMTVRVTNRQGTVQSVDVSLDFYETYASVAAMNADAANIPKCALVSIATDDPTSAENARVYQKRSDGTMKYLFDLDQASAEAWAEWLDTKKPQIDARIATADADHIIADGDHSTALSDHSTAEDDHVEWQGADGNGGIKKDVEDATALANEKATLANTKAGLANDAATNANEKAALADEKATLANTKAGLANDAADYANDMATHPSYIADGTAAHPGDVGYFYSWNHDTQQYVRGALLSLDWASMTEEQKAQLAADVLAAIGFDDAPTENSDNAVKSGGLYTMKVALEQAIATKQDALTFATTATCQAAADEIQFS
jgi:hypothetical protein